MSIKENLISLSDSYNSPALREAAAYIEVLESEVKIQQDRIKLLEREVAYAIKHWITANTGRLSRVAMKPLTCSTMRLIWLRLCCPLYYEVSSVSPLS